MKLQHLLQKRAAIVSQIALLNEELGAIDAELFSRVERVAVAFEGDDRTSDAHRPSVAASSAAAATATAIHSLWSAPRPSIVRKRVHKLEPHIAAVLAEAPLSRNHLFDALVARGVAVGGKNPKSNLSAHLSHSPMFVRDSTGRWALKQKELDVLT